MNRLRRRAGWPAALAAFLAQRENRPFNWYDFSCALFGADWVLDLTGVDLAAEYRGPRTKRAALARLKKISGGGVVEAATRALGEPLAVPALARRGDIAAVPVDEDGCEVMFLGIVDPSGAQVAIGLREGLARVPLTMAVKAWAVG